MKKKCRVYKKAGNTPKRLQNGGPAMTQDSQQDPVYEQRNAKFLDFLKTSTSDALYMQELEQEKEMMNQFAQDGKEEKKYIPSYLDKGNNTQPGAVSNDYGYKKSNVNAFIGDYKNNQTDWGGNLNDMLSLGTNVFSQPDMYKMDLPKGQTQQDFFDAPTDFDYDQTRLDNLDFTGYESAGKRGKDRVMKYTAKGTSEYIPGKREQVYKDNEAILNMGYGQDGIQQGYVDSLNTLSDKHRNFIIATRRNEQAIGAEGEIDNNRRHEQAGQSLYDFRNTASPELNNYYDNNVKYDTYSGLGGNDPLALPSTGYFGTPQFNTDNVPVPGSGWQNKKGPIKKGQQGFGVPTIPGFNDDEEDNYQPGYGFTRGAQQGPQGDQEVTQDGEIYLNKQNKFAQAWDNPAIFPGGINTGMQFLANIGNSPEEAQREADAREQISNVHRRFGVDPDERGDYAANAFGFGDNLKMDKRTRMGYDTAPIAQDGAQYNGPQVDDVLELTEEKINQLIRDGYQLDYLD